MPDAFVYVYAVGDAALADDPAVAGDPSLSDGTALTGVADTPIRVVSSGALAAVVGSVDPDRFGEEALRHSLEDLGWVEDIARAHHRVVQEVGSRHPVAPVRLTTIYHDDEKVRALLDENADRFAGVLDRIRGRTEWGVKAFAAVPQDGAPQDSTPSSAVGPGTAYLARRRAVRDHMAETRRLVQDDAEEVHRQLTAVAVASRRYRPQDPRLSGRGDEMVLNAAYLVDDGGSARLQELVAAQPARALRLELTGPWVPYSFSTLEGSAREEPTPAGSAREEPTPAGSARDESTPEETP